MPAAVPDPVRVQVPAKVNLSLAVGPRRPDGFHELTTVYQAVSLMDEVTVVPLDRPGVEITIQGEGAGSVSTGADNLAARAALVLARHVGITPAVRIELDKGIPVAGGMAGGSADAAGALVACDALWNTALEPSTLSALAAGLGSDVPFALHGGTAMGTGRGEVLTDVLARGRFHWVFAFADTGLSTPQVYAELDAARATGLRAMPTDAGAVLAALRAGDAEQLAAAMGNDLQAAALRLRPELEALLDCGRDLGAVRATISGSGPTCAFLADSSAGAHAIAGGLQASGLARAVRSAHGPVPGARLIADPPHPG